MPESIVYRGSAQCVVCHMGRSSGVIVVVWLLSIPLSCVRCWISCSTSRHWIRLSTAPWVTWFNTRWNTSSTRDMPWSTRWRDAALQSTTKCSTLSASSWSTRGVCSHRVSVIHIIWKYLLSKEALRRSRVPRLTRFWSDYFSLEEGAVCVIHLVIHTL